MYRSLLARIQEGKSSLALSTAAAAATAVEGSDGGEQPVHAEVLHAAECIGYGAVKYFDLKQHPGTNYIFSYERMLDTKGDTAVYLMFAYARLVSILRKVSIEVDQHTTGEVGRASDDHRSTRFLSGKLMSKHNTPIDPHEASSLPLYLHSLYYVRRRPTLLSGTDPPGSSPTSCAGSILCLSLLPPSLPYMTCEQAEQERGWLISDLLLHASDLLTLDHVAERALAFELLQFGDVLTSILVDLLPNRLCDMLKEISVKFTDFVTQCHVLHPVEGDAKAKSRLVLCEATRRTMEKCFFLLGIKPLERI
jgi:arginyl-tRNA synthetase